MVIGKWKKDSKEKKKTKNDSSTLQKKPTINIYMCQHVSTPLFKFPFLFTVLFPSHAPEDQLDPRMELRHGWTLGRAPPGCRVPNQALLMDTRAPLGRMPTGPRSLVPPRQLPSPSLPPTPDEAPGLGASQVLGAQPLGLPVAPESSRECIRASCGVEFLLANAGD